MNIDPISKAKMMLSLFTGLMVTLAISYGQSVILTEIGVPGWMCMLIGLILGLTLPTRITAWILKEELLAIQSQLNDKRDKSND